MLVLHRKKDQVIVIDGGIRITIVAIKGNTVKVGVEAPKEVRVVREELKK